MTTIQNVEVEIAVLLGTSQIPVHQLLRMGRGAIIELNTHEDDDVQILANNIPVAKGQVVLNGEHVGISITEVLFRSAAFRPSDNVKRV
ncbi:FliM/FliN family flagellar motor switch protein [Coralliovum pocilloporae]|uniref:FliM/FliN family flagellar motor switch protein n=1 Tax=Coralliovum pocilloporae TaxID=3066369 RepID=UPI0033072205